MATKTSMPNSVSSWDPKMPSGSIESMLEPNAKDNPDSLSPTNNTSREVGKKCSDVGDNMLGQRGRNF